MLVEAVREGEEVAAQLREREVGSLEEACGRGNDRESRSRAWGGINSAAQTPIPFFLSFLSRFFSRHSKMDVSIANDRPFCTAECV